MSLHQLIAAHKANMDAYHAIPDEDWEKVGDCVNDTIDASRKAVLEAKCSTVEEIRTKAEFMLSCISFSMWDDIEPKELIAAFVPEVFQ